MSKQQSLNISAAQLNALFQAQRVRITHAGNTVLDSENRTGVLEGFAEVESSVDIVMKGGPTYIFLPDTLTDGAVEGSIPGVLGRRRVELVTVR